MARRDSYLESLVADPLVDGVLAETGDPRQATGPLRTAVAAFLRDGSPTATIEAIVAGAQEPFARWCEGVGLPIPTFVWLSDRQTTGNPRLDALATWYRGLAVDRAGLPGVSEIGPHVLRPFLGNLMLLDVIEDGADFRYRLYGAAIALRAGFDWTGKTVRALAELRPHAALPFHAFYAAVLRRPQPLFTDHRPHPAVPVGHWQRLILPFSKTGDGRVDRLLVGNFPIDDPVAGQPGERRRPG